MISPNLALDELVAQRRAAGESIVHLGFGESRLPVFPGLVERLVAGADRNAYGPVAGDAAVRSAVAGYFARRGLPTDPEHVVVAPGSKALLLALQAAIPGDVLVPEPCWVTYAPQARLAGKRVFGVPIPAECGGVPDPDRLRETIRQARQQGYDPRLVVLTSPDNPTGTHAPPDVVKTLAMIAEEEDLILLSDEIYRDLVHDPAATPILSPAELARSRTVVITGLSKSLALGGWRIGAARFPDTAWGAQLRADVTGYASESWSTLAGPMQEVATYAFGEPPELLERLARDRGLHRAVARAMYDIVIHGGAECRPPTGGFYVYPDFEPLRETLAGKSVVGGESLQRHLLENCGVAVLAGVHFGDDARALRFRAATSMLYGATRAEQQAALDAPDPLAVGHVRAALDAVEAGFAELAGLSPCHPPPRSPALTGTPH
nr:pyridoxal phosphate-dependent aminotransferase [Parafrankia colletiae]